MDQIFNEISANGRYADKFAACVGIENLLRLALMLRERGCLSSLRVVEGFSGLRLTPDYSIRQWCVDRTVGANRDLQRFLLTHATRAPFIEKYIADAEEDCIIEFLFEGSPCFGLGLAYLWDSFVLSLDVDHRFAQPKIAIQYQRLCNNCESTDCVEVDSIAFESQLPIIQEKLQASQRAKLYNGISVIQNGMSFFPRILFGQEARKQLQDLTGSEIFFRELLRHLEILNTTMERWSFGPFAPEGITWSTESKSTMDQFGDLRTFICSDGISRKFPLHSKIMSANQRIHFLPVMGTKTVHIGYVGKHLPTNKYRT